MHDFCRLLLQRFYSEDSSHLTFQELFSPLEGKVFIFFLQEVFFSVDAEAFSTDEGSLMLISAQAFL